MTRARGSRPATDDTAEEADLAAERRTAGIAALALSLALVTGGLFLINNLKQVVMMDDCQGPARSDRDDICSGLNTQAVTELTASR